MTNSIKNLSIYRHKNKIILLNIKNHKWVKMAEALYNEKMCNPDKFCDELQERFSIFSKDKSLNMNKIRSIYFAVTRKCNLNCQFCSMKSSPFVNTDKELSYEEILKHVIPKVNEINPQKVIVTGGEPTVRKDIGLILKSLSEVTGKERVVYQTNGILLTEDIVIEFLKYVGTFELSIENLFENPVLLDKMGKIFQVIKSHNGMLNFSFVADRNTLDYIYKAIDLVHKYQASFIFRIVAPIGRALDNEELFSEADIKEIYNGIYEYILKKEYYEDNIVNAFLSGVQVKKSCGGYGNILSIKPDGKLSLCCNIDDVSCEIGDIRKNSIEQIKNSIERKIDDIEIKRMFLVDEMKGCQECSVKYFCSGPCAAEVLVSHSRPSCKQKKRLLKYMMFDYDERLDVKENIQNLLIALNNEI